MNGDRRTNLAAATTSGVSMLIAAAGSVIGALAGFDLSPETWPSDARVAIAGIAACTVCAASADLSEPALTWLRRRLGLRTGRPTDPTLAENMDPAATAVKTDAPTAPSLAESVDLAATAVKDDAAIRAASAAWHIDHSCGFLDHASQWQGHEDGTATYYLAPGILLHHHTEKNGRGLAMPHFTLLTGDDRELPVAHVKEIHAYLLTRAARDGSADEPTELPATV
ncbi:hypothetical protein [Streptomyces albidoflavus]|uniref:hypothetical protein n=1 Tax=Streptomyces albidoflavus TaxID=1886 RepID=UPI001022723E|nr:hypothetical protein [Streptomyces albidoflavus]RZE68140.1 hypothetical protein C0Q99_31340 [Streptomyces albidoflavus]